MKDNKLPEFRGPGVRRIREIRDGTSLTIVAGSVSPERKIPWTKPEDISLVPDFKALGEAGSFAAPHKGAGLFLFGDGSVKAIRAEIPVGLLQALFSVNSGEIVDDRAIPAVGEPDRPDAHRGGGLQLIRTPDGVKLRIGN